MWSKSEEQLKITRPNFRAARLDLHYMYQKKDESLNEFVTRCRTKAAKYDFSEQEKSERIIEQILESTPIVEFQKFLLDTVINEGRKHEAATHNMQLIKEGHCSGKTPGEIEFSFIKKKKQIQKLQYAVGKTMPGIKKHALQKIPDVVHVPKLVTGKTVV